MASTNKEVIGEFPHLIKVYNDGTIERFVGLERVPPSLDHDPAPGLSVSSKDITISENPKISARLYLPKLAQTDQKLPILVYFHGGGFCVGSAFASLEHRYVSILVSEAQVVAVSIEFRLAPENPLPAAYEDCWDALKWVVSTQSEPWILNHGDLNRLYIAGDSTGGNIAHNTAMRAGVESLPGNNKILGAIVSHAFFWGSEPVKNETKNPETPNQLQKKLWDLVYPDVSGGIDNPKFNPAGPGAPSLAQLGCSKILVCVADKDALRDRGEFYYELIKESGWEGEAEFFELEGDHGFHFFHPETENAKKMVKRFASFLS